MPVAESTRLLEEETLRFARALIRIDSVNTGDPATIGDGESRAIALIAGWLEEAGYTPLTEESAPGRANLVLRVTGADPTRGALVAHAHVDVVPADPTGWAHPPFAAEIADGYLYGRGALDMKNHAAALVAVARAWARDGIVPNRDIVFAFFSDEEAGGVYGARWVTEHRPEWLRGVTEAVSEVGGFSVPLGEKRGYLVATSEKGVGAATLTARGRAGHGSRPSHSNAVTRLARAVVAVGEHEFPIVSTSAMEEFALRASELLGVELTVETLEDHLDLLGIAGPLVAAGLRDTVSPTMLAAGSKTNVIPGEATAQLDTRILPGTEGDLERAVEAVVAASGPGVEIEWSRTITPLESPARGPLLDAIQEALLDDDPDGVVVPYLMPASTDNKHLRALGITGYGFVPLRTAGDFDAFGLFHAVDERIPLDALAFSVRVTERLLRRA
ncbi:M20/M25/M40 family metallo-hydrolase [Frondihabitans cladoniiphilus]|uniref:M20/M25/M40 family metallo-hydrolase n=1 Tax=Frondihabitans cladoniiphilus TaxID=715785 RepID=A0ABP8VTP9_9MICO